jgi:uncharacterized protein YndB with AHSA1/START domain
MTKNSSTHITVEPGKQEIFITREFDAPRELVFKAYTDPRSMAQWWGPKSLTTTVEEMDVRPGGRWRITQRDVEGNGYAFHGVYHTVEAPSRLVSTFEFEGVPGHVSLDTLTFEEQKGKTEMKSQSVFQSVADRDGMVQSGMEAGVVETYDRFAELLAKLSKDRK